MSEEPASEAATSQPNRAGDEFYILSDEQAQVEYVGVRRAAQWVPFLLPHLRSGMRLLDCGCGVGSITLDLAEIVAPGETVGVDLDENQLAIARAAASTRNLANTRFRVASVYELPFADASFDVVLAHTVLFHLSDQLRALKELRRVLAPGGIVAISDDDWATWVVSPEDSPVRRVMAELGPELIIASGGNPFYSRHLRRLLLEAGFARTEGFAVAAEYYGRLEETRRLANVIIRQLQNPDIIPLARQWVAAEQIDSMCAEVREWGERPDSFAAVMYCAALGWVDTESSESDGRRDRAP